MKKVIILVAVLLLISCGVSKKAIETNTKLDITTEIEKNDSSTVKVDTESLVNTVIENLNKTTTVITIFNPPDTSGKQSINRTIEVKNDIQQTTTANRQDKGTTELKAGKNEQLKQKDKSKETKKEETKKGGTPLGVVIWGIVAILVLVGAWFVLRRFKIL